MTPPDAAREPRTGGAFQPQDDDGVRGNTPPAPQDDEELPAGYGPDPDYGPEDVEPEPTPPLPSEKESPDAL